VAFSSSAYFGDVRALRDWLTSIGDVKLQLVVKVSSTVLTILPQIVMLEIQLLVAPNFAIVIQFEQFKEYILR